MKKLKEKIVDFRKRHAKGLEKLNKGLNWFLIVLITFIVGLFLVGTVKGCSDSLKNNHTDKTSDRLVSSSPKGLAITGNYSLCSVDSSILVNEGAPFSNTQFKRISPLNFVNYAIIPSTDTSSYRLAINQTLTLDDFDGTFDTNGSSRAYLCITLTIFNPQSESFSTLPFTLGSNSIISAKYGSKPITLSTGLAYARTHIFYSTFALSGNGTSVTLDSFLLYFSSLPRVNCMLALTCFVADIDFIPDMEDFHYFCSTITASSVETALASNRIQPFFKRSIDTTDAYKSGYDKGLSDGKHQGYDSGFNKGYSDGSTSGYNTGYNKGYTDGSSIDQKNTLQGLFLTAFQSPFHLFQQMFDVNVLGINLGSLLASLIVLLVCAFVVKRLI